MLHSPGEPALLITAGERRTAVSEIPPLETEIQNPFVRESIKAYTSPDCYIDNGCNKPYAFDYTKLPKSDLVPTSLNSLQYEPEELKFDDFVMPAEKKGYLNYSTAGNRKKKFWIILRRVEDDQELL